MTAVLAVVLIALPAFVVTGFLRRDLRRGPPPEDSYAEDVDAAVVLEHAPTTGEAAQLQHAVARGRRLDDPWLRGAAVTVGRSVMAASADRPWWPSWLLLVWLVALAVVAGLRGQWTAVPMTWCAEWTLAHMWLADARRRAVALNSGRP